MEAARALTNFAGESSVFLGYIGFIPFRLTRPHASPRMLSPSQDRVSVHRRPQTRRSRMATSPESTYELIYTD